MSTELSLSQEQGDILRQRLIQKGFSIILEGIYVKDEEATDKHRFGFQVFDPVARFECHKVILYNPNNNPLSESQESLIGLYGEVIQHGI